MDFTGGGASIGASTDLTVRTITAATGTITTSSPAVNATQTWNAGGVTFTGWKLNVTDTASASASLLMDLQVGGSSYFSINKAGNIVSLGGNTALFGEASQTLAQRNSTAAQSFRVYNTYTDASNYERFGVTWSGNVCTIGTTAAGTGSSRALNIQVNSNNAIAIDSSGNLTLGGTLNTTISNFFVKTNFAIWSNTSNVMHLSNTAFNAAARLVFGPAVSTGWACIKPNAAQLQVRLADDSADAPITVSYIQTVPVTVAGLPAAATAGKGARAFVTDANATTYASIVAGSGANNVPVYSDGTNWRIG